jgi:CRISPR system Cascade subunit CasA
LNWEDNNVIGYKLIGGDAFERENCFTEQMTMWYKPASKQTEAFLPKRHNSERQMWRDFASLLAQSDSKQPAGIITWLTLLRFENLLSQDYIRLATTGVQYGDKDFFVDGIINDSLEMSSEFLSQIGSEWVVRIVNEIENTDQCVWAFGQLAGSIAKAAGNDTQNSVYGITATARGFAFTELDPLFRSWLHSLNPAAESINDRITEYRSVLRSTLFRLGEELVAQSDIRALLGREKSDGTTIMAAPQAFSLFKNTVFKILRSEEVTNDE